MTGRQVAPMVGGTLCAVMAVTVAWAAAGAPPKKVAQTSRATQASRVTRLADDLQRVSSAAQATALLEKAKLSDAELRELANELSKSKYKDTLERIRADSPALVKTRPPTPMRHAGKSAASVLAERRSALEREHERALTASDQRVKVRLATLHTATVALPPRPTPAPGPITRAAAPSRREVLRDGPQLADLEPERVECGENVTLHGRNFGRERGAVALYRDGHALSTPTIQSWTDTRIVVGIPTDAVRYERLADVPDDVGGWRSGRSIDVEVLLGVKQRNGSVESRGRLFVLPDIEPLRPRITSVTPMDATPGAAIIVEGANFGSSSDRAHDSTWFSLAFQHRSVLIHPEEWHDSYIVFRVDEDVQGLPPMDAGELEIKNRIGLPVQRVGLTFTPAEEVVELNRGLFRAWCHPALVPPLCLFGDANEATVWDMELRNGWRVDDSWLSIDTAGPNAGAYYRNQPSPGDTRVFYQIVTWADAYSRVECRAYLTLRGPAGTSYE